MNDLNVITGDNSGVQYRIGNYADRYEISIRNLTREQAVEVVGLAKKLIGQAGR